MFAIANDRKSLWQWDLNQQLTIDGDCTEVHYLDRGTPSTLTVEVKDGKADIPNILLQKAGRLVVYAYIIDAQDHHTKVCETFGIAPRPKPAEYVYTETEVKTWSDLQSQIGDLADLATEEKNNLVAAINEAAQSGGGGGGTYYVELNGNYPNYTLSETTPLTDIAAAYNEGKAPFCRCSMGDYTATLPLFVPMPAMNIWIFSGSGGTAEMKFPAQYFTIVVSAQGVTAENKRLVQTDAIVTSVSSSSTNAQVPSAKCVYDELQKRNLKQATSEVLGGVKADPATADDTQPVRIDDSGKLVTAAGSGDISLGLTSASVGQTIKVKTVDTDGRPTSWEAADISMDEQWELLGTLDASTGDVLQLDFSNPVKKLYFLSELCDTAGEQYGASTTVYRQVTFKVGDIWRDVNSFKIGCCKHSWHWKTKYWLECGANLPCPKGEWTETLSAGNAAIKLTPFNIGDNNQYSSGLVSGIRFSLVLPDGTENTASGTIKVWGVKA